MEKKGKKRRKNETVICYMQYLCYQYRFCAICLCVWKVLLLVDKKNDLRCAVDVWIIRGLK